MRLTLNLNAERAVSRVLVIDDEQLILSLLEEALSQVDFSVVTASAGSDGIRKFDEGVYDLVITDIRMPGSDGNVVIHHIRNSKNGTTPVIGISGTPVLVDRDQFDRVLTKPFAIKALIDTAMSLTRLTVPEQ